VDLARCTLGSVKVQICTDDWKTIQASDLDEFESWGLCHVTEPAGQDRMMKNAKPLYHGHRFPAAVISCASAGISGFG
jgi:hypothetical protein